MMDGLPVARNNSGASVPIFHELRMGLSKNVSSKNVYNTIDLVRTNAETGGLTTHPRKSIE